MKSFEPNINFTLNTEELQHGKYIFEIILEEYEIFLYYPKCRKQATFEVTNYLNGKMNLIQGPIIRENGYVSSQTETTHSIVISEKDMKLYNAAAYIRVYWFVDCLYVGMTDTLNFTSWYRTENGKYNIEALLMLSFEPFPTPVTTTTPKPTTTTTTTTTTTSKLHKEKACIFLTELIHILPFSSINHDKYYHDHHHHHYYSQNK